MIGILLYFSNLLSIYLTFSRNAKSLQLLKQAEKTLEENKIKEYINPELSVKAREEGNEFFKVNKYPEAVKCYTEAIARDPGNHVNYSNRAATYIKLMALPEALKDADKCIEINPKFGMFLSSIPFF